jgi:DNA-binding transcriptional LysR family regulator
MYEGPEFRQLRYFVAVADLCSFSKAAEKLHVSQPILVYRLAQACAALNIERAKKKPSQSVSEVSPRQLEIFG